MWTSMPSTSSCRPHPLQPLQQPQDKWGPTLHSLYLTFILEVGALHPRGSPTLPSGLDKGPWVWVKWHFMILCRPHHPCLKVAPLLCWQDLCRHLVATRRKRREQERNKRAAFEKVKNRKWQSKFWETANALLCICCYMSPNMLLKLKRSPWFCDENLNKTSKKKTHIHRQLRTWLTIKFLCNGIYFSVTSAVAKWIKIIQNILECFIWKCYNLNCVWMCQKNYTIFIENEFELFEFLAKCGEWKFFALLKIYLNLGTDL